MPAPAPPTSRRARAARAVTAAVLVLAVVAGALLVLRPGGGAAAVGDTRSPAAPDAPAPGPTSRGATPPAATAPAVTAPGAVTPDASASPADAPVGAEPGPVVLIPGLGGDTRGLATLADALAAAGRQVRVVELPGRAEVAFAEQVAAVEDVVEELEAAGARSVDLVGYSNGGVLARHWVRTAGVDRVRRVVTLGSPHHGTRLALLATVQAPELCSPACRDVVPGSAFLDALNADDETPDGPVWTSVFTSYDEVVTPVSTSALEGALNVRVQDVCAANTADHGGLPRDPFVVGLVLQQLGETPLDAIGPGDCAAVTALAG